MGDDRYKNLITFIYSEKFLTITVLGSIFTFQFINAFKSFVVDPLFEFMFPYETFQFLNVKLRDGIEYPKEPKPIYIEFGTFLKSIFIFIFLIWMIYMMSRLTKFPDDPLGNIHGAAIM
jgi:large-conductance mechanosensitive channel